MKRGRPKLSPTEIKVKFKNIAVDADTIKTINAAAGELEKVFGFRPTLSQTVRHLLRKVET